MQDYIRERVLKGANYMIENKCTMEEVANELGTSESTVHADLRERLEEVNPGMKRKTDAIIKSNIVNGKSRGGLVMAKRRREESRVKEESEVEQVKRPPLGLMPRKIWLQLRVRELLSAMDRYSEEMYRIPVEWIEELSQLSHEMIIETIPEGGDR